jgi:glycerophosphoryl diester phosphodiesterase
VSAPHRPLLIGHRGASGYFPEHTLPSYALAILQGADFIEPDLVATRDGVLIARHENEIGGTTDVASHPEFASRRRVQSIDGVNADGWFTEDFTLDEIKTLRARERIPQLRPANARHDGQLELLTFDEILDYLAQVNATRAQGRLPLVGVYPETKHPSHFALQGLALEAPMLASLRRALDGAPVFIQSFEVRNLQRLREQCDYPLVQLMAAEGGPWDRRAAGPRSSYAAMAQPAGLREVADYATAIGVQKSMVMAERLGATPVPTTLVHDAHVAGLAVHVWTFRAENAFLPLTLRRGDDPAGQGDMAAEIALHLAANIDGLFSDQPDIARRAANRHSSI